uniref:Interferon-related developmental regulator N-terminal domain-containing protein n=1 Tax=Globisporangium ultimum (strain ATCC 200006 / CBS 805.95 / DAOM BR144) TaxID=431595 RepID=K3WKD3_GLOUD
MRAADPTLPRAGGRKMRNVDDDDDFDDAMSMASIETGRTHASDDAEFYDSYTKDDGDEAAIDEAIEELTEKRTTTRVAALEKLSGHLSQYLLADSISESFVTNVLSCLRKPSEDEAIHGARVLALMSVILGGDEERFFQRASNVLEPLAKTSRSAAVKAASIRALALICFVCSVEDENTESLMKVFEKYFDLKIVGSICSVALEAWGLLASSLSDEELAHDEYVDRCLPQFLELLTHVDVEVRSAAGENIALLYESAQKCGLTLPYDEEIVEKFRVMSKDNSKKNSKKDRKTQRMVFRDVHATLANGESPQVSFSVKNELLDVSSWRSIMQLEAIKNALRTGFQEHIKYNNVVRSILDLPESMEERVIDRRGIFDKKSASRKQKSNELKGDRRRKQHLQDAFYDE